MGDDESAWFKTLELQVHEVVDRQVTFDVILRDLSPPTKWHLLLIASSHGGNLDEALLYPITTSGRCHIISATIDFPEGEDPWVAARVTSFLVDPRLSPRHDRALGASWATEWLPTIDGLAEEDGPPTPETVLGPYTSEDPFNMRVVEKADHPACQEGHTFVDLTFTAKHPYNVRLDKVQFIPGDDFSPVGSFPRDGWLPMKGSVAEVSGCTQFGFTWSVLAAQGPWLYPPVGHSAGHFVP